MVDNNTLVAAATPVFFLLIGLEAWLAHRKRADLYRLADSLTSLGCGVWTVTLEVFTKGGLMLLFGWVAEHVSPWRWDASRPVTWLFFFFLLDFLYYWAHRWSHEINLLWGGHAPHHQSEEFNFTTALRQGAFQDTLHMPIYLPLAVLGCPPGVFVVLLTFSKFYQFWIHTRLIGRCPMIEGVLNTPSAHRVHHAVNDRYLDCNYGGTLMVWDRLFGTWEVECEPCIFGVRAGAPGWNPVRAQFVWFGMLLRDARHAARPVDKLAVWFRRTGWRPSDCAAHDPGPPFQMAQLGRARPALGMGRAATAVAALIAAAGTGDFLLKHTAALAWSNKLALAALITALLLAMARLLRHHS